MIDKQRILLIIPNLGRGGAQQVFHDQLRFYSNYFDVTGCVFNWDGAFEQDRLSNIVSLDVPAGRSMPGKIYCFFRRIRALRKLKKKLRIDLSISHLEGADYVNILSKRAEKTILWIHGTKEFDHNIEGVVGMIRKKILIPYLYRNSNGIVTVSEGIRKELIKVFGLRPGDVRTVTNGFDVQHIKLKARERGAVRIDDVYRKNKVLVTHCRLARQKNISALISIFHLMECRAKLVIVGDGELKQQLVDQCISLNMSVYDVAQGPDSSVEYDVYFIGYLQNPYPYLTSASLYVMTSLWEGFPLALCEAMACGVPVVASDCFTGPREILAPALSSDNPVTQPVIAASGVLMPLPDAPQAIRCWAETIDRLLMDENLMRELSEDAQRRVLEFDKEKIVKKWLEIAHD